MNIKYPHVKVVLTQCDGNAFALIGATNKALNKAGVAKAEITEFTNAAYESRSYDALLQLIMRTVEVS